jgi:hypothetical protein
MSSTTTSTIAGLMETINAGLVSQLGTFSGLWNAPFTKEADNALTVNFPTYDTGIRTSAATASTEGSDVEVSTITINANAATLVSYPVLARVSKSAIKGGVGIVDSVTKGIGRKVGNTIDGLIYDVGEAGFTTSVTSSDGFSLDDLSSQVATLKAAGYGPEFVAILDPRQWEGAYGLQQDILALNTPMTNDNIVSGSEMRGGGYQGRVQGVDIYTTHMANTAAGTAALSGNTVATALIFSKDALAFGYGTPLVELESQPNLAKNAYDIGGSTFCVAKVCDTSGGVGFLTVVA